MRAGACPLLSSSVRETRACAAALAKRLRPGDVLLLSGPLGAGKTAFAAGVAAAKGSPDQVSSPTFVFIHEYAAGVPLVHIDLYRLPADSDIEELGVRDYLDGTRIVLVEWPERAPNFDWGLRTWKVRLETAGETARRISVEFPSGDIARP